jgi:hypothetical protein
MKRHEKQATVIVGTWWLRNMLVLATAFHYGYAARRDERNGFVYTAAMEWRHAAELFPPDTLVAGYCWTQWERIMSLPRRLAHGHYTSSSVVAVALSPIPASNDVCGDFGGSGFLTNRYKPLAHETGAAF